MDKTFSLVVVAGVACLASLATFTVLYLIWLRSVLKRLVEVQALLKTVSHLFHQKEGVSSAGPTNSTPNPTQAVPKLQMCVEGKEIAILEIDGREVVRFREDLSEVQKKRIIQYLTVEGFLSRH